MATRSKKDNAEKAFGFNAFRLWLSNFSVSFPFFDYKSADFESTQKRYILIWVNISSTSNQIGADNYDLALAKCDFSRHNNL